MDQAILDQKIKAHKEWLESEGSKGERLCLQGANLWGADFQGADFQGANLRGADLLRANFQGANLRGANLWRANFQGADLQGADLRGVDLDFSYWPLWCSSFDVKVDKRIAAQLAYHFCRLDCDDPDYIKARNAIIGFANQFHRVEECGELLAIETEGKWLEKENENLSRKGKEIMGGIDASEAIEKQIPKKPIEKHYEDEGEPPYVKYACPNDCGIQLWPKTSKNLAHEHAYCPKCGQKIDWEGMGNEGSGD